MERRGLAVCLLALFLALNVLAAVFGGDVLGADPGWVPWTLQVAALLSALTAGMLLLTVPGPGDHRPAGFVVVGVVVVLALLDAMLGDGASVGAIVGAGLVRLACLGAVVAVVVRMGMAASEGRRT